MKCKQARGKKTWLNLMRGAFANGVRTGEMETAATDGKKKAGRNWRNSQVGED